MQMGRWAGYLTGAWRWLAYLSIGLETGSLALKYTEITGASGEFSQGLS